MNLVRYIHIKRRSYTFILAMAAVAMMPACKKSFLETKPRTDILVPTTLKDMQQLLDNYDVMNETPELGELSADNFYLTNNFWNGLTTPHEKNGYIWAKDIYGAQKTVLDWNIPYTQVLYANVILEGIEEIAPTSSNQVERNQIKGAALFARSFAFYNLVQLFALPYDVATATSDPGIPLRLSSDINAKVGRSSVAETYDRIITDLLQASQLLPPAVPIANRNRASQSAALALLARVHLSMNDYTHAGQYANDALKLYDTLLNYNNPAEVRLTGIIPFPPGNIEMIFQSRMYAASSIFPAIAYLDCIVDSSLFKSYVTDDLRQTVFYTTILSGNPNLKFSYNSSAFPFTGLATDELYLIRAECTAWAGNYMDAMTDLNTLLQTRWKTNTYVNFTASSKAEALDIIRRERRKELAFRGIRWSDLRRLNKEAPVALERIVNGVSYMLAPNSSRYVLPIPPDVIKLGNIDQNDRQ